MSAPAYYHTFLFQLLAALLITRQVVGNIKESIIPYAKKHFKLAQLSFDRYGALSPTSDKEIPLNSETNVPNDSVADKKGEEKDIDSSTKTENCVETKSPSSRSFSQVECESSAPPVSLNRA